MLQTEGNIKLKVSRKCSNAEGYFRLVFFYEIRDDFEEQRGGNVGIFCGMETRRGIGKAPRIAHTAFLPGNIFTNRIKRKN